MGVILLSVSLIGCVSTGSLSTIPFTDSIVDEVGGLDNIPLFQYYLSQTITLRRIGGDQDSHVEDGNLVRRSAVTRDAIIVDAITPGVAQDYGVILPGLQVYEVSVAFEDRGETSVLNFWNLGLRGSELYTIRYDDPERRIVNYGGVSYVVEYDEDSRVLPHLLIKLDESASDSARTRRVPGLTLQ